VRQDSRGLRTRRGTGVVARHDRLVGPTRTQVAGAARPPGAGMSAQAG
jgi:hypothetical protein